MATGMLLAVLGAMAVAGDTLTSGERAPIGPKTINELIFPGFCPPRVDLVKSARDHDAPGLEGSFVDGALEFFSPGWPFSAHAQDLGVQNLNESVSIWTSEPYGIRHLKCRGGHDPTVFDRSRLEQLEINFFNSAPPRLSTTIQFLSFHHVQISPPDSSALSRSGASARLMDIRSSPQSAYHLYPLSARTTRPIFGPTRPLNCSNFQTLNFHKFPSQTWNEAPVPG